MDVTIREVADTAQDFTHLDRFYEMLFIPSFPDPDERESLENMKEYLRAKSQGWYESLGEKNSYHILLAERDGNVIAAAIFDYLAGPNVGILEFILVSEQLRGQGIGNHLHRNVERVLQRDAASAGHATLDGIVIEMNDPYQVDLAADNVDPFERAKMWGAWNYNVMEFPCDCPISISARKRSQGALGWKVEMIKSLPSRFLGQGWTHDLDGGRVGAISGCHTVPIHRELAEAHPVVRPPAV